jgi:uncharacterized membrane protein YheB (UPF0754 family)
MQERVNQMCEQQQAKTLEEIEKSQKCEDVVRKATKDIYSGNCREITELHDRWIKNAQQSTFFDNIPSKERFAPEYRAELDNIINETNSLRVSMNEIESFEARSQRIAYEFAGKGILTFMVALGLGIGTTRRVLDWRAEAAAK